MSKIFLIGKKIGMTSLFDGGRVVPVTLIKVEPNVVVCLRNYGDTKGVVLAGNGEVKKSKRSSSCYKNLFKDKVYNSVKEFRVSGNINVPLDTVMRIGDYLNGAIVDVRSTSIGKGFQGAMKRWGFGGLCASHGVSLTHRSLGSTGNRTLPGRVFKGKKMAGRMGGKNVCVQNMVVCAVDTEANVLALQGSVPGKENSVVYITNAAKKYIENDNVVNGVVCEG